MTKKTSDTRIIKKYLNRRLYDSKDSRYITLEELKALVIDGEDFRVVTKSNEDVTESTLINLLFACDVVGQPVFTEQSLRNMIMIMHGPMRGPMRILIEQCLPHFHKSHQDFSERFGNTIDNKAMENLAMTQATFIRQMMEQYVFQGLENYMGAQNNFKNAINFSPLNFANFFTQPPSKKE